MVSRTASRGIAALAALAIALMVGFALALPMQAHAGEPALTVGTQADDNASATNIEASYTWIKAGKRLYQWNHYKDKKYVTGTLSPREMMCLYFPDGSNLKITNIETSNANVIKATAKLKSYYMKYTSKSFGTATINYTRSYVDMNGKTVIENVAETHKIVKYANPLKTFKVGTKNYASKFKKTPQVNAKSALKGKISVKAAKGWKIKKIRRVDSAITSGYMVPQKKLTNNKSKVNIKKSDSKAIEVICYNKKGKYYSSVVLTPNFKYQPIAG